MPMSYPSSATTNQTRGSGTNGTHYKVRSRLNVLFLKSITKSEDPELRWKDFLTFIEKINS